MLYDIHLLRLMKLWNFYSNCQSRTCKFQHSCGHVYCLVDDNCATFLGSTLTHYMETVKGNPLDHSEIWEEIVMLGHFSVS